MHIHSEHKHYKRGNVKPTKDWLKAVIMEENKVPGEINIIFMGDDELKEINSKYLKHDYYTDVITFNYNIENKISGDIFISYDRIVENAASYGVDKSNEVNRIIIHGILHLLGYNDKRKREILRIREKENYYLGQIVSQDLK
ncbi:MAG: rRNA maturation RNase YbeY [Bacteroidota bacterium]|nr:rRNA maturation RNase YbeY [Bacteroidota bacterium]